jgi:hypothetical protein
MIRRRHHPSRSRVYAFSFHSASFHLSPTLKLPRHAADTSSRLHPTSSAALCVPLFPLRSTPSPPARRSLARTRVPSPTLRESFRHTRLLSRRPPLLPHPHPTPHIPFIPTPHSSPPRILSPPRRSSTTQPCSRPALLQHPQPHALSLNRPRPHNTALALYCYLFWPLASVHPHTNWPPPHSQPLSSPPTPSSGRFRQT